MARAGSEGACTTTAEGGHGLRISSGFSQVAYDDLDLDGG